MEIDIVHKVLIKVLADEGLEYEVNDRGCFCILCTVAKPSVSEEERREATRNSWAATEILCAPSQMTQEENGPKPLEQVVEVAPKWVSPRRRKEKGGVQLCRSKLNRKHGRRF